MLAFSVLIFGWGLILVKGQSDCPGCACGDVNIISRVSVYLAAGEK